MSSLRFILASTSLNRRGILDHMGFGYEVVAPDYEEIIDPLIDPEEQIRKFALGKAQSVWEAFEAAENFVLVGTDSMIGFEGRSLGKPKDVKEARANLLSFVGKTQTVETGVALIGKWQGQKFEHIFTESTTLQWRSDVTESEIDHFLAYDEWQGKCGGYSLMGMGALFLESVEGDFQNVVGLPIRKVGAVIREITGQALVELV